MLPWIAKKIKLAESARKDPSLIQNHKSAHIDRDLSKEAAEISDCIRQLDSKDFAAMRDEFAADLFLVQKALEVYK